MDPVQADRLGADFTHPAEILEPEDEDRAHSDRVRLLQVLSAAMSWVHRAERPIVGAWQVSYALGLNQADRPMIQVAAELGIERATLSGGAWEFLRMLQLPPSPAMRSEGACDAYSNARKTGLKNKTKNGNRRRTKHTTHP